MEGSKSNTTMIVAVIVVIVAIVGGVLLFANSDDDESNNDESNTNTSETEETAETGSTIVDLAVATPQLSTLVTAVQAAGLVDTLADPDAELTVFAPTNAAFDALPDGTLDSLLLPENVEDLTNILTYHVVPTEAFSSDLSDGQQLTTVNGQTLTVSIENGVVKINDATVTTADVDASNGVVHIIDAVLLPPQYIKVGVNQKPLGSPSGFCLLRLYTK